MKKTRGHLIAVHAICWLIFLSLPAIFIAGMSGNTTLSNLIATSSWLYFTIYIFIFYLHTNFLFPKLYFGKKYILYFIGVFLLATAVFYLRPFDRLVEIQSRHGQLPGTRNDVLTIGPGKPGIDQAMPGKMQDGFSFHTRNNEMLRGRPKMDIVSIVLFIMIIALSITIVIIKRWRIAMDRASRAESDKVTAELSILKAQINPHFLFNTLNNIYSQAVMKDEHTAESIMKLSNIMRYVTDDAMENYVSLVSETNFISDYIELQRLRLGSKVTLDFSISGNMEGKKIAPLILITFIENVFKYGISNSEPSTITITLKAGDKSISFFCRNMLFPLKHQSEGTHIGIVNTRKRLEHLYPDRHTLNTREEDGFFSVYLILQY